MAEGSDASIQSDRQTALAERMRLRAAITSAVAEGHAIISLDRNARDYLIGPTEAKGRSFLAGCLFKKDPSSHDHNDNQGLPTRKAFARDHHGNQKAKEPFRACEQCCPERVEVAAGGEKSQASKPAHRS